MSSSYSTPTTPRCRSSSSGTNETGQGPLAEGPGPFGNQVAQDIDSNKESSSLNPNSKPAGDPLSRSALDLYEACYLNFAKKTNLMSVLGLPPSSNPYQQVSKRRDEFQHQWEAASKRFYGSDNLA